MIGFPHFLLEFGLFFSPAFIYSFIGSCLESKGFAQRLMIECIVLFVSDMMKCVSQMPVILIPLHFDRDPILRLPSCQRSIVIRTFLTNDFMTGIPATPGDQIPQEV